MRIKQTRILLLSLLILGIGTNTAVADTIDSLYHIVRQGNRVDYQSANRLMLILNAEGAVDSLYKFTAKTATPKVRMEVSCGMGQYYTGHQRHSLAAKAYHEMAQRAHELEDTLNEADALAEEAYHYYIMGDFETAMATYLAELRLDSLLGDTARLSSAVSNLASTHMAAGYPDDAARYIREAIRLEESLPHSPKLAIRYGAAAEIMNKKGETEEALRFAERAYELDSKAGNTLGTARRLSQMADIYDNRGELERAEKLYMRAIDTLRVLGEPHSLGIDLRQLGRLCQRQGRWKESIAYLQEATDIARKTGNRFFLSLCTRALADSYHATGQNALAYECLNEAIALNDSMHTERLTEMASEYRTRYDMHEQEAQIERQQSTLKHQQLALAIALVLLLLTVVALCLAFRKEKHLGKATVDSPSQTGTDVQSDDKQNAPKSEASQDKTPQSTEVQTVKTPLVKLAPQDREFLVAVSSYIHENMTEQRVSIDSLAEHMCMSRSQLSRRFLSVTGDTPNNYITRLKLEKAVRLLKSTDMTVKEIAWECGFDDSNFFTRTFRTAYGITPTQYRNTPIP